ncbi:unnamed protein product, partial [Mesorhabditis belari]|uniref:Solute-binding protein family 3/N-terminal domain-containing protein n=1 Tax=Mesorhabditis belari TaxID=2138241 RepID=A0AAF3J1Y9_9BILA
MRLLTVATLILLLKDCRFQDVHLGKQKIRVVYARNPPDAFANCLRFPQLQPNLACPFPGYTLEMMGQIAAYAGYDVEPVLSQNIVGSLDWGTRLSNDTWVGVLGMLANDTADVACLMYQRTDLRDQYFDFSYPLTNVQPIYVVREKTQDIGSILWNAFKPYSTVTWFVIVGSFITQVLVLIGISRVEKDLGMRKRFRPFEVFWQCIQLQLDEHSEDMNFFTIAGNIVMFFCALLQSGFLIKLYEGLLLSALLAPPSTNPFKNADGLIQLIGKGQYHLVTNYMGNWYFDDLVNSNDPHFVSLRAATANNPVVLAKSVSDALDMVESGPYVYPIQEDSLAMQMSKERCNLVYVSDGLPQVGSYFVFQNKSRFLKSMNTAIIMNSDMIQHTFSKYFREGYKIGNIPKCTQIVDTSNPEIVSKPLNMASTVGIFTLGAIGIAISTVVFFVEIYIFLHNRVLESHRKTRAAMAKNL